MTPDGPKWGQEDFFLLIQTLPTFWAERILILKLLFFGFVWLPAWARLGPRAWARAAGPGGAIGLGLYITNGPLYNQYLPVWGPCCLTLL